MTDDKVLLDTNQVLGIILGGGKGTRLYPLTDQRSKPAVPLGGKYRLIDIPISNCINSDIRKVFVLTQYLSASLNRHVNLTYKFDHFKGGFVEVLAAEQTEDDAGWFRGTADAVRQSFMHFERYGTPYYLILSGDQLYKMDYRRLMTYHIRKESELTVASIRVDRELASSFGLLEIDDEGHIIAFVEKPKDPAVLDRLALTGKKAERLGMDPEQESFLASMGIYVFDAPCLESLLSDPDKKDFGKDVIPASIQQGRRVYASLFQGYWEDIGTIKAFYEANLMMTQKYPPFDPYDSIAPIYTNARYLPSSKLYGANVKNCLIAEGSIIEDATCERSIIGLRSIIRDGAVITDSMLMGTDYYERAEDRGKADAGGIPRLGIGRDCVIRRAIIDKNVRIGNGVRIVNQEGVQEADGDGYCIRDGIVVVKKGAILSEGTVI